MGILSSKRLYLVIVLGVIVLLCLVPIVTSENITFRIASIFTTALFATSFNLLLGYTGIVSFGHAAYFAIGAYAFTLLTNAIPSLPLGIILAFIISALSALLIGFIALRATGIYFSILTLALGQLVYQIFYQSTWSGGQNGIAGVKAPSLNLFGLDLKLNGMPNYYFVVLVVTLISFILLWLLVQSRFGKTLITIREDATRAAFIGVNVKRYQLIVFVISGAFTGVAGALAAPLNTIVTADMASWIRSADPIIVSLLGGFSYFFGPAIGAVAFEIFNYATSSLAESANLFVGLLLLIVILVLPKGILGLKDTVNGARKYLPTRTRIDNSVDQQRGQINERHDFGG